MNAGRWTDLERPVVYVSVTVFIWVVIGSTIETVLFDGDLVSAVSQGVAGGLAFGLVMCYLRQNAEN